MMFSFDVLLLVGATSISGIIFGKVSFLITGIASEFRYSFVISSTDIFLVRMPTFGMMVVLSEFLRVLIYRTILRGGVNQY